MKTKSSIKRIGLFLLVVGVIFVFVILSPIVIWMFSEPPFFADFDDAQEVKAVIISEFPLGETTYTEVETALNANRFGGLNCYMSQVYPTYPRDADSNQQATVCEAVASDALIFPGHYNIIFYYEDYILVEVDTALEYK